ncbi:MAG: XdhC family protein [Planctomycetes bacterium]|nr:XdhC family protein [Planctomycetota bacterium]
MQSLIQELDTAVRSGRSVCYTALVETRGSTPQKAGAAMLVFPDGSQVGTLGGGCVEAEVKRRALQLLPDGSTELLTFQLDSDYGWDDGLICGGRMKMLVDPVRSAADASYYRVLLDTISAGHGATEAVVIEAAQSGGGTVADRWLLDERGEVLCARAVGPLPSVVLPHLRSLDDRPRPYIDAGISYLPTLKRCRLVIVGAGHVGQRVAELATDVGFDVWVVDDRQEYCNPERFPRARRLIVDAFDTALGGLQIDSSTYCIIVTRGHNHDEQALFHLAETKARYVGMIGSRRKIKLIFDDLLRDGITRESLRKVSAPLGFDIGSQTVPEIAVSIVAELVAHRNLGHLPDRIRPPSILDEGAA